MLTDFKDSFTDRLISRTFVIKSLTAKRIGQGGLGSRPPLFVYGQALLFDLPFFACKFIFLPFLIENL